MPLKISRKMDGVFARFGGRCVFCDGRVAIVKLPLHAGTPRHRTATVDHAVPACRGGSSENENLLLACAACNGAKGDMTDAEFRSFIATGRIPLSYIDYLADRMRKVMAKQIPHVLKPVET